MFELELQHGACSLSTAAVVTVSHELVELWEYAGYGDILQNPDFSRLNINNKATKF